MRAWPIRKAAKAGDYLNIGSGPHARPDFFNVDFDYHPGVDLFWDLNNPLPIADNSVGGIFTEHCLEHLGFEVTQAALRDFNRVMLPGAAIRISVPDGELYIKKVAEGSALPGEDADRNRDPNWTRMRSFNHLFYGHGHRFIYDFETMKQCLKEAGFINVRQETIGSGRDPRLLIDQPEREPESLYVEASKPPIIS